MNPALILTCTVLLSVALATRAGSAPEPAPPAPVVDVWPEGKMPGAGATEPEADLPARGDGVRRVTNVSRPTLTLFPAARKDGDGPAAPAVVVCPGGGYRYVVHDKEGTAVAAWLNSLGVSALVLTYRVPDNRAGALQDVQRALSLARANAAAWGIDPDRLGVMGFSAGGNLAAKASTGFGKRAYDPVDAADAASCRPDFAVLVYPAYLERDGAVAPDLDAAADVPPTLIVHSDDDRAHVAGSKVYHAALLAARKAPVTLLLYPTGGHGYGLRSERDARAWPKDAAEWLRRVGVAAGAPAEPLRVVLVGDSTVRAYPADRPDRGWGQFLAERFAPGAVTVANHAASGRSTKTFIAEGRWEKALAEKPDYVLIQFGHNDSHAPGRPESTDAATDYRENLRRYVDEARAAGATPILVTPMVRRTFDADGRIAGNLGPYADAVKAVAAEKQAAVIDLHDLSRALAERLGPDASAAFANKPGDVTHFNEKGARAMADLVLRELPSAAPGLRLRLKTP